MYSCVKLNCVCVVTHKLNFTLGYIILESKLHNLYQNCCYDLQVVLEKVGIRELGCRWHTNHAYFVKYINTFSNNVCMWTAVEKLLMKQALPIQ